jgi:tRNA dimethylallyltransferase
MDKLLLISGPTASGKTKLALDLAKQFDGELISADSRQVYQGMDIVTGKDVGKSKFKIVEKIQQEINKELNEDFQIGYYLVDDVPIWGLDILPPYRRFDTSNFIAIAKVLIKKLQDHDKLPILVGGTAFWLKSLIYPPETLGIPINTKLRAELEDLKVKELQKKLKDLDPEKLESFNESDIKNPRRLIRAIEVASFKSEKSKESKDLNFPLKNLLWLAIQTNQKDLINKISKRVDERIKQGALDEVKKLFQICSWQLPSMSAIGYRDFKPYIEGFQNLEKTKKSWILHEAQYAKRQLTFLNKIDIVNWIQLNKKSDYGKIKELVEEFINKNNS